MVIGELNILDTRLRIGKHSLGASRYNLRDMNCRRIGLKDFMRAQSSRKLSHNSANALTLPSPGVPGEGSQTRVLFVCLLLLISGNLFAQQKQEQSQQQNQRTGLAAALAGDEKLITR